MCNLSDNIYDKAHKEGYELGEQQGIEKERKNTIATLVKLVNKKLISAEDAAESLDMPINQFKTYLVK